MGKPARAVFLSALILMATLTGAAHANPVSKVVAKRYLPVVNTVVTSAFGPRIHPVTGSRSFHSGVDLAASLNQRVRTVLAGKVLQAGRRGLLGNAVEVLHEELNISTIYGHLNKVSVKAGQKVARGQQIGLAGSTGRSTGVHLHFTVKDKKTGTVMEPLAFIASISRQQKLGKDRLDRLMVASKNGSAPASTAHMARLEKERLAAIKKLQAELKQTQSMLAVFQELYNEGLVSRNERDEKQKTMHQIESNLAAAQKRDTQKMHTLALQKANDEVVAARAVALNFELLAEEGAVSRNERSAKLKALEEAEARLRKLKPNS